MAWIDLVSVEEARGLLRRQYDEAIRRAGRVWHIVSAMSPNPRLLRASMALYQGVMKGPSPLDRGRRELLAVVVSAANGCVY